MLYRVINPSDPIAMRAPSRKIAALVLVLIGGGQYSGEAYSDDGDRLEDQDVPFFMFGGFKEFWKHVTGEESPDGAIDRNRDEVISSLRTVMLGEPSDLKLYESAVSKIDDPEKRQTFIAEWNDERRSSLNDIMGRAHRIADKLEGEKVPAEETAVPRQVLVR
jgi:hypothetical protein